MRHNFKLIRFTILYILFCSIAFGQEEHKFSLGFHGGPAYASRLYEYKKTPTNYFQVQEARLGVSAGVVFQFKVKPKLELCFGADYERKGYINKYESFILYGNSSAYKKDETILEYLTIPFATKYFIIKKKIDFYANIGFYASYLTRIGWRAYLEDGTKTEIYYSTATDLHKNIPLY